MNSLIASLEIGFQVTISKSTVQMTSNLFSSWSKIGQLCILTFLRMWWSHFFLKENHQNLIWKTLVSHPGTPCHNELCTCGSKLFSGIWIPIQKSTIKLIVDPTALSSYGFGFFTASVERVELDLIHYSELQGWTSCVQTILINNELLFYVFFLFTLQLLSEGLSRSFRIQILLL